MGGDDGSLNGLLLVIIIITWEVHPLSQAQRPSFCKKCYTSANQLKLKLLSTTAGLDRE